MATVKEPHETATSTIARPVPLSVEHDAPVHPSKHTHVPSKQEPCTQDEQDPGDRVEEAVTLGDVDFVLLRDLVAVNAGVRVKDAVGVAVGVFVGVEVVYRLDVTEKGTIQLP